MTESSPILPVAMVDVVDLFLGGTDGAWRNAKAATEHDDHAHRQIDDLRAARDRHPAGQGHPIAATQSSPIAS